MLCITSSYPRSPSDYAGGFVRTSLQALAARGHRVTVVHPHGGDGPDLEDDGPVHRIAVRIGRRRSALVYRGGMPERLSTSVSAWTEAPRLLTRVRAAALGLANDHDVVLTHWLVPGGWVGASIRRRTARPHVCVLHSGGVSLLSRLVGGRTLARWIARRGDLTVAVSESVAARWCGLVAPMTVPEPTVVVNPVDAVCFAPADAAVRHDVLFVGRLERVKGLGVLLDALRSDDNFDVMVAGEGAQAAALRETAERRRLKVRWVGRVDAAERSRLLRRARALVVPSIVLPGGRTEGAPMVVAEAHAAGVPVIASRVGGLPEMIDDGSTGVLVPAGDANALRLSILNVLHWDAAAAALACRARAERYRPERHAEVMEGLLMRVVNGATK